MEVANLYVLICCWWFSLEVVYKASFHELGIFMLDDGEVSWSMRVFLLRTSYDSLFLPCIQD